MQRTYNLSLFNNNFKNFMEKRLLSNSWNPDLSINAYFSDYTKDSDIKYGFVNTHKYKNLQCIFKNNKYKKSYITFTKKQLDLVEKFLNTNPNSKFYLKCSISKYNKTQYTCRNVNQIKNILNLRYSGVPNNVEFILEKIISTICFEGEKFTINVPFLVLKYKEELSTYIYPEWYMNLRDPERSENKEEINEKKDENKVESKEKNDEENKGENKDKNKIDKNKLTINENDYFCSKNGASFRSEYIKNKIIESLKDNLDTFKSYLKISTDIYNLEKNLKNNSENKSDINNRQLSLFIYKIIINNNGDIIPLCIQNMSISNYSKINIKEKVSFKCLEDCIENFIVSNDIEVRKSKFIPINLLFENFVTLHKSIKSQKLSNNTFFMNNVDLNVVDLSASACSLAEKILSDNKKDENEESMVKKIISELDNIKKISENPIEIKVKKKINNDLPNKLDNKPKSNNQSKKMLGAALLAGTSLLMLGKKKFMNETKKEEDNIVLESEETNQKKKQKKNKKKIKEKGRTIVLK